MEGFSKYSPEAKKRIAAGISFGVAAVLIVLFFIIHFKAWTHVGSGSASEQFSHFYKTLITGSQSFFNR